MKLRIVQRGPNAQDVTVEDEDGRMLEGVVGVEYTCSIDEPPTIKLEMRDMSFDFLPITNPPVIPPMVLEGEAPGLFPDADEWLVG